MASHDADLADQGGEVIETESQATQTARVSPEHFAIGHRGSRSIGLDTRRLGRR